MAKEVTFQKIADELGVSKGLVSLAMRNKYGVSEEMRSKIVLKAIELGYEFKKNAPKKKKNITLLVKNMGILNEDFWRRCILGIENECVSSNVSFTILGGTSLKDGEHLSMNLLDEKCDGIIILNQCQSSLVEELARLNIPTVFVDMVNRRRGSADQVVLNNFNAGMQAVNYLLKKGPQRHSFVRQYRLQLFLPAEIPRLHEGREAGAFSRGKGRMLQADRLQKNLGDGGRVSG